MRPTFKTLNQQIYLYTKGKEFIDVNGDEYIGEYHYSSGKPYTGPTHTSDSKLLKLYNSNKSIISYDKIRPDQEKIKEYKEPYDSGISPKEAQYDIGFIVRYFIKRVNDSDNVIYEVSEDIGKTYGSPRGIDPSLYQLEKLNWYITKDPKKRNEIELNNYAKLQVSNIRMPGLVDHISSLYEYSFDII